MQFVPDSFRSHNEEEYNIIQLSEQKEMGGNIFNQVDLYDNDYCHFKEQILAEIRRETYGEDIGQNSWITTDEYDTFYNWLNLSADSHVLDVASGSGGPALYLAKKFKCRTTGIDINEEGLKTATRITLTQASPTLNSSLLMWISAFLAMTDRSTK